MQSSANGTKNSGDEKQTKNKKTIKLPLQWSAIDPQEYELQELIGEGTFGSVVKATHKPTGTDVAIKLLKYSKDNKYQLRKIVSEL